MSLLMYFRTPATWSHVADYFRRAMGAHGTEEESVPVRSRGTS